MEHTQQDEQDALQAAQHHADMLAYQRAAREALKAAGTRPLSPDEIDVIAFVGSIDIKEKK